MSRVELEATAQKSAEKFWNDAGIYFIDRDFGLDSSSRVMDVGGYLGDFTDYISRRYDCYVDVYEPVVAFYDKIVSRFADRPKVTPHCYGLDSTGYTARIALMGDASSMYYTPRQDAEEVRIRDVTGEIRDRPEVDLLALNCEGGEYGILQRLLDTGSVMRVRNILVQFHTFHQSAEYSRDLIRQRLSATHVEKFCYPYVWEAWRLR